MMAENAPEKSIFVATVAFPMKAGTNKTPDNNTPAQKPNNQPSYKQFCDLKQNTTGTSKNKHLTMRSLRTEDSPIQFRGKKFCYELLFYQYNTGLSSRSLQ
jgi:hypothetical protein